VEKQGLGRIMKQTDLSQIIQELRQTRCRPADLDAPDSGGVYAVYVRRSDALSPFSPSADGLIYVGVTSNLARRELENHFNSENSGFSTLRRSLGSILKSTLGLTAIPRAPGASDTNVRNFRFTPEDDAELTTWMHENLEVGLCVRADYDDIEDDLIARLEPVLNLTKWPNPDSREIRRLRRICANEARENRTKSWGHVACQVAEP
jgi:hypothetical protein